MTLEFLRTVGATATYGIYKVSGILPNSTLHKITHPETQSTKSTGKIRALKSAFSTGLVIL